MRLRYVLPRFNPAIEGVVVTKWHKVVGDQVTYGEPLCDVVVREMTRIQRAHDAGPISARSRRRKKKKEQPNHATRNDIEVPYRVTSLDSGVVSQLVVGEGEWLSVGAIMAEIDAEGDDGEAEARLILDRVEDEGEANDQT